MPKYCYLYCYLCYLKQGFLSIIYAWAEINFDPKFNKSGSKIGIAPK